ncbi:MULTISPECIES: glycine--tRNA ligase subunit beta [unclassified Rickettsia]|uniref:glycine--tRNA ligase subunit beta n=1 Tax=unclassified Rickettsia TaxID=114295 RepID=UPI003133039B
MSALLLELFSEEIPAFMQRTAEEAYLNIFTKIFEEQKIFAKIQVFSGPRRITAHITHLPKSILPQEIEIKGPAVGASDAAIQGFCKAHNTSKLQLSTKLINNHLYYFFIKKIAEKDIKEVLPEIIVTAINRYSWAKSMYWGDYKIKWIRPLRNILCIFDDEILPLKFGHLTANNVTYAHRLKGNKTITVNNFTEYKSKLLENDVILERLERQEIIKAGLAEMANLYSNDLDNWNVKREVSARSLYLIGEYTNPSKFCGANSSKEKSIHNLNIKEDERLIEEVTGLAEFPVVMIGRVPEKFLKLPKEVLISSMRTHQKYFCLFDNKGNFAPYFLFVCNGKFSDSELVVKGNEKVLAARLADALYFYKQDLSHTLESQLSKLERVTFHAKLGNLKQKTERITKICHYLAPENKLLRLAAKLCKSDLVSEMVGEFPELQGIMGYYYAIHEGLEEEVAVAIRDHYKPQGPSDNVPTGNAALLAIADKLDSLVGLMLAGEAPSGSGDPYALRRQALGIIRIILDNKLQINIIELINFAGALYKDLFDENNDLINSFFEERAKFYFKNQYDISLINAVLDLKAEDNLVTTKLKLEALQKFLSGDEGTQLLIAYKRASNILGDKKINGEINTDIFTSKYERELYNLLNENSKQIEITISEKDFTKALSLLSTLLTPIADFFDNVLVNDEDRKIADNRLLLLQLVRQTFRKVANFNCL